MVKEADKMVAYDGQSGIGAHPPLCEGDRNYVRASCCLAGERYLGLDVNRNKHAAQLREAGKLKGPLMKVAQILSTIPDALPPEYAEPGPFRLMPHLWAGCL